MLEKLHELVVRPAVSRWLTTSGSSVATRPSPGSMVQITVAGPDPDRMLVMGGGVATGWGLDSQDTTFPGRLAKFISELTGRGVEANVTIDDFLAGEEGPARSVTAKLRSTDAVVITPGDIDSLLMLPPAVYHRRVNSIIDRVTEGAPASVTVFVVGLVPLSSIIAMPPIARWFTNKLFRDLDREALRATQSRRNATFVPLSGTRTPASTSSEERYASWAAVVAPIMAGQLDSCGEHSIF
ncbi:MAG: hypothetical protein ACOH10_06485 [Rhodoglobus sp.]|uniref:hypothetical protein n=1 Tax=Salinibacterium sp. G-O1 TaxID=3046208 RepID=UPI0024BBE870|nr:hypothetical protein [Salinibacterium sp. G-O1]MDJ0335078.1 hypothetical protein [Salinibacterium sp. G-O1]